MVKTIRKKGYNMITIETQEYKETVTLKKHYHIIDDYGTIRAEVKLYESDNGDGFLLTHYFNKDGEPLQYQETETDTVTDISSHRHYWTKETGADLLRAHLDILKQEIKAE